MKKKEYKATQRKHNRRIVAEMDIILCKNKQIVKDEGI